MYSSSTRHVVVIGGTSGIGLATATEFACRGDRVVAVGRPDGLGRKALPTVSQVGETIDCEWMPADVSDPEDIDRLFERLRHHFFGRLDVAVNAAGIPGLGSTLLEYPLDAFRKVVDVNLIGTFLLLKQEAAMMIGAPKPGGVIFNVGSVSGVIKAATRTGPYSASKAAVHALTRVAANELASQNIRIISILPGNIETPLLQSVVTTNPGEAKRRIDNIPLGRLGQPREVANMIIALANVSTYVTGTSIVVDGGAGNA